jgi:hypothetical protein
MELFTRFGTNPFRVIITDYANRVLMPLGILMEINHPDKIGIHVKLINRESYRVEKKLL